jgi:hypothetical protein
MKTKQTILKAFASVALALSAFASADAQTNLGADCGCPDVNSRGAALPISGLPGYTAITGTGGGSLTQGATLTCDKLYLLDVKIYVPNGQVLNIAPGTLIKAGPMTDPALATALVISRGGKINAAGTESCPIVFTAQADPMNGTYSVSNVGMWGGVVLLGKATNNLTLAANGPFVPGGVGKLAIANGLGTVEGFASTHPLDQYGVALNTPTGYVTGSSPALSGPNSDQNTYTFGLTVTGTANTTVGGFRQFKIASEIATFVLNGMTISDGANSLGVVTNVGSASSSLCTVTTSTTGTALSGNLNLTFKGTYPQAAGTSALYFTQDYPTGTPAGAGGVSLLTSPTGPIGFATDNTTKVNYHIRLDQATVGAFDDEDNSGTMKYVSIRHSGAILQAGAEINGLTLASVGRGTTIDHIEIVSCADDNIEIFGGTVNLKYITTIFGNDDMFDYDLGWKGKAQFFFGMKNTTAGASPDNDNGIEADSDDNTSNASIKSHPILYNFTILGNGKLAPTADNRGLAGVNFKEQTEGELYNSIFVNFKTGINLVKTLGTGRSFEAYDNWSSTTTLAPTNAQSLKIKCNTLWNTGLTDGRGLGLNASSTSGTSTAPSTADDNQFVADLNTVVTGANGIPGLSYAFTIGSSNAVSVKNDVTPNPSILLSATPGCPAFPSGDTFFTAAPYRGAFSSVNTENWLTDWSYSSILNATKGLVACPGDLNSDGAINIDDFLVFLPLFNSSCN